ncbi:LexA family transcriptional repressor [Bordetella genomosp. 9]|uniref:LexA family transcriptional repressor n=2 Tax=Bordetella genomosp. 9 TaxID=1416803 RepID=A0A261RPT3_9BORD|nr:LexA family transcriptional repressor [Bordetella genomosp. 9]
MTSLQERLKEAMAEADGGRGISQSELARRVRVTRSAIAHWVSGAVTELKGENLIATAGALGVNPTWLSRGTGPKVGASAQLAEGKVAVWDRPEDLPEGEERVWIDRWDYRVSAGDGGVQWEIREKAALPFNVAFFQALGSKPANCKLVMVRGDSMEPFLFNRDMVMVDVTKTAVRDGVVYAVLFEDEPLVKQVFKKAGGALMLHSYNSKYPDRDVTVEDMERLQIIGEVVYRSGSGFASN